jgi:hypothetical protein
MIVKNKTVIFYKWERKSNEHYNVLGQRSGERGSLVFSVYKGKEKIEKENGELAMEFVRELAKSQN